MGDRYVKKDDNKKIITIDHTNLFGHSMSQLLPYDESEMWHGHSDNYMKKLKEISNSSDNTDIGYFVEFDMKCPGNIKEKTIIFPFPPENKITNKEKNND